MNIYLLSDTFHEGVINLPQIKLTCKDVKLDLTPYEALIFSSKNAVLAINKINNNWKKIRSYLIGRQTAKTVKKLGGNIEFISSSSYGDDFAKELIDLLKDKKVIFLRAKTVLSNLENILKNADIDLTSKVIYETTCREKTNEVIQNNSVIIFTSPSTVDCFFKNYKWDKSYKAVFIGDVTAKAFPLVISSHISKIQTIKACIELAKTLIKQN